MGDIAEDAEMAATRRQASTDCDRIEEAIEAGEFDQAADAWLQLGQRIDELQEGEDV